MGGSGYTGDGLVSQSPRHRMPRQPLLNRHQVGAVSRSPDGLFAQHRMEHTRGRPARGGMGGRQGYPTPTSATHPRAPVSPPPHPVCLFRACSHTRGQRRLQHQEWDPHRYPAMEPPSTSRVGPTQVPGHGTCHDSWGLWSGGPCIHIKSRRYTSRPVGKHQGLWVHIEACGYTPTGLDVYLWP